MPARKRIIRRRSLRRKPSKKPEHPSRRVNPRTILVDLVRDLSYRYGLAMARFEFKARTPKPSIDEFRERIAHHINLMEASLKDRLSGDIERSLKQTGDILNRRLRLDVEKIRNGVNAEVEAVYESLK